MSETRLTPERRAELARLCEAASATPELKRCLVSCPAYGNYQPPYEDCICGADAANQRASSSITKARERLQAITFTALPEALAEVDRLTARWEALKEGTSKIRQHWASFHSVAPSAVAEVQTLVARLEAQP